MPSPLGLDDLFRLRAVGDPQLEPNGARVAFVRSEPDRAADRDVAHVWVVDAAGGEPVRLTHGERGEVAPRWSPDGRWLAFLSSRQVWLRRLDGGEPDVQLTSVTGGVLQYAWSPAGDRIAFTAVVRPADDTRPVVVDRLRHKMDGRGLVAGLQAQLFVASAPDGAVCQLTFGDASWITGPAWSPDGAGIAYVDATHPDRDLDLASHLFVVPAAGGAPRRVTDGPGTAGSPVWTPDGRRLVFAGKPDARHLMTGLFVVDAAGGQPSPLLPGFDRTVMAGAPGYPGGPPRVDGAGERVTFCARLGGCVHLHRAGLAGGRVELLTGGEERVVSGFSARDGVIAFVAADAGQPGDVFLREADGAERRLTEVNREVLGEAVVSRPERRVFIAADGCEVEAFVYAPERPGPAPLLLDVHGGPHNAHAPALGAAALYRQALVARGWCVVAPNPRGSDGYGLSFMEGVRGAWGRADQQDFLAVIDGLVREGVADPARLAVTGYSYGGFTTTWLIGQTTRFKAAVAGGVVTNVASMYGTSDFGTAMASAELGAEPFESWQLYDDLSPARQAARIETPLLILHGEADDRCPIGQAEELFALLRRRRRTVRLVRYPGASHLFVIEGRPSHRHDYQRRLVEWVTAHVPGG